MRQPNFVTAEEAHDLVKVVPNLRDRAIVNGHTDSISLRALTVMS